MYSPFPATRQIQAVLVSILSALSQTPAYTVRPYVPAFTGTHCTYPQRDGQAELTWVADYMPRCLLTVAHPIKESETVNIIPAIIKNSTVEQFTR